jgi:1,2-dihydroxy-3-keto-5-methylthiopentene dioxygenase
MTLLQIMPEHDGDEVLLRSSDLAVIAERLARHGVSLTRLPVVDLPDGAGQDEVLAAYGADVDQIKADGGFRLVDVVRLSPSDDPEWPAKAAAARAKFLDEHQHDEDEVRFFVAGSGCFYLHLDGTVHAVVCTAGDLMSVPAGTRHWYDMGTAPDFCAIRFFQEEDGWVADFTGDTISRRMPDLGRLLVAVP